MSAEWLLTLGKAVLWWAIPLGLAVRELWLMDKLKKERLAKEAEAARVSETTPAKMNPPGAFDEAA